MVRQSLCMVVLLLVLGPALLAAGAAGAQSGSDNLIPRSVDLPPSAFRPVAPEDVTIAGADRIVESNVYGAPAAFTHLMLTWEVTAPEGSATRIEYRTSNDQRTWSAWNSATAEESEPAAGTAQTYISAVLYTGEARSYQFRVTLSPGTDGTYPELHSLRASTLDARSAAPPGPLTQPSGTIAASAAVPMPAYKSRTAWGNPQGESAPGVTGAFATPRTVTHLIVHHTAGNYHTLDPNTTNWDEHVRAIWAFHTYDRGWGDIGYNWLIAPNGVIYAGRAGSTYSDAVGFHDTANFGSMGVAILGDYSRVAPSAAAQESLVRLLAWKASQRGIDPFGRSVYWGCLNWSTNLCARANPDGVVANIEGHRKVTPAGYTPCPGDAFYALLPTIRQRVATLINGGPDATIIDNLETTFWRSDVNWYGRACGYNNHTFYTYATNNPAQSTNHGVWRPKLPRDGTYRVRVHIPQGCAIRTAPYATTNARYQIVYDGGSAEKVVDHNAGPGAGEYWVELGTYRFRAGDSGYVRLTDLTNEPYSGDPQRDRVIFFDAVSFEYVEEPPRWGARLLSAQPISNVVPTGGLLMIAFTIQNTGNQPLNTQDPAGASIAGVLDGTVYDAGQCFWAFGGRSQGMLRATLGFAPGSASVPISCADQYGDYPWRWGLRTTLQPGETRTIIGYVRFNTPGTYTLQANLVSELIGYYGADGGGTPLRVGPITVKDFHHRTWLPQVQP